MTEAHLIISQNRQRELIREADRERLATEVQRTDAHAHTAPVWVGQRLTALGQQLLARANRHNVN